MLDRMLLRLPVIGPVLRKIVVARFTRTLGTLLTSGVPILDALDICAKTAGNVVVGAAIHARARQDLRGPGHGRPARPRPRCSRRW
jgi:type II secretory pathway component PulF